MATVELSHWGVAVPFGHRMRSQLIMNRPRLLVSAVGLAALAVSSWVGVGVSAAPPAFDQISFAPAPIAANGSLTSGEAVTVCVQAKAVGVVVPGASIYLSLASNDIPSGDTGGGGTAEVGSTPLTSSPGGPFTASSSCTPSGASSPLLNAVAISYVAPADGGSNGGAPYPVWGGRDVITGQDNPSSPTVTNTVQYEFSPVTQYVLSPSPIASEGSLPSGTAVPVTLTVSGAGGAVPDASVLIALTSTASPAGSATAIGGAPPNGTACTSTTPLNLTSTPTRCITNGSGQVSVSYTPSSTISGGSDILTAQNHPNFVTVTSDTSYTYSNATPDARTVVRGSGAGVWELKGLDLASPVFAGAWSSQGGLAIESPAVVSVPTSSGAGQPLYLVTGVDHNIYVSLEGGAWAALSGVPAYCSDAPAATVVASTPGSTAAYTLVVACRGHDGALWWVSGPVTAGALPSGFTGWASLGGLVASGISGGPAVTAVQPSTGSISFTNELTFFVNGVDGRVWETTAAAGSAGWATTGWICKGHLAAGSFVASSTLTSAFACQGGDQAVWAATTTGTGWDTQRVGGTVLDGPGLAISPTSWTVVAEGVNSALWQDTSTTTTGSFSFSGWTSPGGILTNGAVATALLTRTNNP